jgi:tetratricopeptide (TPR) repeat protein
VTRADVEAVVDVVVESYRRLCVPKNAKGKIGIVVAVQTENDEEKLRMERDLIRELDLNFQHSNLAGLFKIIKYPPTLSRKIDSPQDAGKYVKRSRAHFIVYGDLVQRQIDGKLNYVFRLRGLVVHTRIPNEVSRQMSSEFGEILPNRVNFPVSDELVGFEFTQKWLAKVAKFMTGTALFVSGNLDMAHTLLISLEGELKVPEESPIQEKLRSKVEQRLVDILHSKLINSYIEYTRTRDERHILDSRSAVESLLARIPDDYRGLMQKAIVLFFEGKTAEAIDVLCVVKSKDSAWRYSLGFLYAFEGDIENAMEQYKKAAYGDFQPCTAVDIDEFIGDILRRHPTKIQLHFFRGVVNLKRRSDYVLAKQDFERFLASEDSSRFKPLVDLAEKYLSNIKTNLGL